MILSQSIKTRQTIIIVNKILKISNGIEPFATLFWALVKSTSQQLTLHAGPASLHRRTQSMSLYGHSWFNSLRRRAGYPPFLCLYIIYCIYEHHTGLLVRNTDSMSYDDLPEHVAVVMLLL